MGMIIARDLATFPNARHAILVPWRDLAHQTASELGSTFGISVTVVGDGKVDVDVDITACVVVCVYQSVHHLARLDFRTVFVDEAHHLEWGSHPRTRSAISTHVMRSDTIVAEFSATFKSDTLDFVYSFEEALRDRYVCDLRYAVVATIASSPYTSIAAVAELVRDNLHMWAPMLVVFNTIKRARECARMLEELQVHAVYVEAKTTKCKREFVKEGLSSGRLPVCCLVGLFHEGTDIKALRTVVLADPRRRPVRVQQLAMRVSRVHPSKEDGKGNIVQVLNINSSIVDDSDLRDRLACLTRPLQELTPNTPWQPDSQLGWLRKVKCRESRDYVDSDRNETAALGTRLLDGLGQAVHPGDGDWPFQLRMQALQDWMDAHNGSLPADSASGRSQEKALADWLRALRSKQKNGELRHHQLAYLDSIFPPEQEVSASSAELIGRVREWAQSHGGDLPRASAPDGEEAHVGKLLQVVIFRHMRETLSEEEEAELIKIRGIQQLQQFQPLQRTPRPYQLQAAKYFFDNAEAAGAQGRPLRFEMACGTGKTYIFGMIISQDLRRFPDARHVVLVPWRDLAHQTAKELRRFGLTISVVGDGLYTLDRQASVVVCVLQSAWRLRSLSFRIKLVDEAHHVEGWASPTWQHAIRHYVRGDIEAHFSATFRTPGIDFSYSFQDARSDGFICGVRTHAIAISDTSPGLGVGTVAQLVQDNLDKWAPMFVVFNSRERARECARLLAERQVLASYVDGDTRKSEMEHAKECLACRLLDVVCIVGVFHEGTDVEALRTVVFADQRHDTLRVQQMAMRVSRLHPSKPDGLGNVVQVLDIGSHILDDSDLRERVASLTRPLQKFVADDEEAASCDNEWFRTPRILVRDNGSFCEESGSAIVDTRCFDQHGRAECPEDANWLLGVWVQRMQAWMESSGGVPPSISASSRSQEKRLAAWLQGIRRKRKKGELTDAQLACLGPLVGLLDRHRSWPEWMDKLCVWLGRHDGELPRRARGEQVDAEEACLRSFLTRTLSKHRAGKLSDDRVAELRGISPDLEALLEHVALQKKEQDMISWQEKVEAVREWTEAHGKLPNPHVRQGLERRAGAHLRSILGKFRKGQLSEEQEVELRQIEGLAHRMANLRNYSYLSFPEQIDRIRAWTESHGKLPRALRDGDEGRLGQRLEYILRRFSQGKLHREQVAELRAIPGMEIRLARTGRTRRQRRTWHDQITTIHRWTESHAGELPKANGHGEERTAASLLQEVLRKYKQGKLSESQQQQLRQIEGIEARLDSWSDRLSWQEEITAIREWAESSGGLPSVTGQGQEELLGRRLGLLIRKCARGKLSAEQGAQLMAIQGVEERVARSRQRLRQPRTWRERLGALHGWTETHGGQLPRQSGQGPEGELAKLVTSLLRKYSEGKLSEKQENDMKEVPGMDARMVQRSTWSVKVSTIHEWIETSGGELPSPDGRAQERFASMMLEDVLRKFSQDALSEEQEAELREIQGLEERMEQLVRPRNSRDWQERLDRIREWAEGHDGELPRISRPGEEGQLASSLNSILQSHDEGKLSKEQMAELKAIEGMEARIASRLMRRETRRLSWAEKLGPIREWTESHGQLPRRGSEGEESRLARLLDSMLVRYSRGELSEEREAELREISGIDSRLAGRAKRSRSRAQVQKSKTDAKSSKARAAGCADGCSRQARIGRRWQEQVGAIRNWTERNGGRLPQQVWHSEEGRLASVVNKLLKRYFQGGLSKEQEAELKDIPGLEARMAWLPLRKSRNGVSTISERGDR